MTASVLDRPKYEHLTSAVIAIAIHILAVLWMILFSSAEKKPKNPIENPLPVSIITEREPENLPSPEKTEKTEKIKKEKKIIKHNPRPTITRKTHKKNPEKMPHAEDTDCSLFDESSCSPCLAEAKICAKCCSKNTDDSKGTPGETNNNTTEKKSGCPNPPCEKEDPCTAQALTEMKSTFCPGVRQAVYSQLGRITLSFGGDTFLAATISVRVDSSGSVRLHGFLKKSGNTTFDNAIQKAVSRTLRVLPSSRVSACAVSRGCVFPVTIGARKVKKTESIIKLNSSSDMKSDKSDLKSGSIQSAKDKK
ncbi:MAG: TonB C-terminal domain-containing protein [Deltaproteobacteria bacterium]|nr:TonB C-terminal domain-containing protein [Deltaproteobacteria bacterium]